RVSARYIRQGVSAARSRRCARLRQTPVRTKSARAAADASSVLPFHLTSFLCALCAKSFLLYSCRPPLWRAQRVQCTAQKFLKISGTGFALRFRDGGFRGAAVVSQIHQRRNKIR